jgi:hypothetical protein
VVDYTLAGDAGALAITGTNALLDQLLRETVGSYTITGTQPSLLYGHAVAPLGAYSITGSAATFAITESSVGSYAITGLPAALLEGHEESETIGAYSLTGSNVLAVKGVGKFYITECKRTIVDTSNRYVQVPSMPPVAEQMVPITLFSLPSSPFSSSTRFVIVNCDHACSIAFGASPTAAVSIQRMAPNETRRYGVMPGQSIAVIENS